VPSKRGDDPRRMNRAGWIVLDTIGRLHAYPHDDTSWLSDGDAAYPR
jgi:hypothetical protein